MRKTARQPLGRFTKTILICLLGVTVLNIIWVFSVKPLFLLNENQLLYLFSSMAQIIGGVFGLTLTAYVFFVDKFKEQIPRYMVKHQVRPGLTGWAQVKGYRGDTSIRKRIDCDLYYIENWTLWFDIKIIFMTFFTGFINKNAY